MEAKVADFEYTGDSSTLAPYMHEVFHRDGCFILRNFFNKNEIQKIRNSFIRNKNSWAPHSWTQKDKVNIYMWNQPGSDVTGLVARAEKVVSLFEQLLGGEVYHYYSAAIAKGPYAGFNRIPWHQDYFHWYNYGCLMPNLATMYMCLNPIDRSNGCLQAWLGTTKCGRLDHLETDDGHIYCDPARVTAVGKVMPLAYVELQPGDILVRHCNLLHGSGPNFTAAEKMEMVVTYNKATNSPIYDNHHRTYTPIQKVPSSAILDHNDSNDVSLDDKDFIEPPSCPPKLREELYRCSFH